MDVRVAAARVLAELLERGQSLNRLMPAYTDKVPPRDRGLLRELCFGCARWQPRLQLLAGVLMSKPLKPKDGDVHALILIGLYQLLFTRIPDHAALGSCVDAAKKLKKPWAARLINGVLRNAQRRREELETQLVDSPVYQYSHPSWLIEALRDAWPEQWRDLLDANNLHPPMTLRVNQRQISREDYLSELQTADCQGQPTRYSEEGVTLEQPTDPGHLPGFTHGRCSVQDEAAQLAAELLDLAPGQRILDVCCAPGGKACHILEREPELASLTGIDVDEQRLARVGENLARLGLRAELVAADASDLDAWWNGEPFDRILLDAPCSATGVIRRHPDIKLLRRASDIAKLATLQLHLLEAVWASLKPRGLLVYATCSVMPRENEQVVQAFLDRAADAEHRAIAADWGHPRAYGRQLFPQAGGHDGFYYACLRKL